MVLLVSCAVHPASHSWPIDISDPAVSSGNMCAIRADVGRDGILISAVCVEYIADPSGSVTGNGCCACWTLMAVASDVRKCPVLPESAIAISFGFLLVVELPVRVEKEYSVGNLVLLLLIGVLSRSCVLGAPLSYVSFSMLGAWRGGRPDLLNTSFSPHFRLMMLFPPIMLSNVAES
jgi:hypothetical protein